MFNSFVIVIIQSVIVATMNNRVLGINSSYTKNRPVFKSGFLQTLIFPPESSGSVMQVFSNNRVKRLIEQFSARHLFSSMIRQ